MEPYNEWSSYDDSETWFDYTQNKKETKDERRSFRGIEHLLDDSIARSVPHIPIINRYVLSATAA